MSKCKNKLSEKVYFDLYKEYVENGDISAMNKLAICYKFKK